MYLCIRENRRRDDFVWAESLSGVNEGGKNLRTLLALRC